MKNTGIIYIIIFFCNLTLCLPSHSQFSNTVHEAYIDSLYNEAENLRYEVPQKAISNLLEIIELTDESNHPDKLARTHYLIGSVYTSTGLYTHAMEHMLKARELFVARNNIQMLGKAYNSLGNIYWYEKLFQKALDHYYLALPYIKTVNDTVIYGGIMMNIGLIKMEQKEYDSSEIYFQQAVDIWTNIDFFKGLSLAYHNLGSLFFQQEQFSNALKNQLIALSFPKNHIPKYYLADYHNRIGLTYLKLKRFKEADKHIRQGLKYAEAADANYFLKESYLNLSKLDSLQGNYLGALRHLNKYIVLNEAIYNEENTNKISSLQVAYDRLKTSEELEQLKQKNALNLEKITSQKRNLILLIIIVLLLSLLIFFYFSRLRYIRNTNELLRKTNDALKTSEKKLKETIITKDRLFSIIAHDLKNPFNNIIGISTLFIQKYKKLNDEKKLEYVRQINLSANRNFNLLENLLQWSKSQSGKIKPKIEKINLSQIIHENLELIQNSAKQKNINLLNQIPESVYIFADHYLLNTVLRNLITNAIKFTNPSGKICLHCRVKGSAVEIRITDNGLGMQKETQEKLFKVNEFVSNAGTRGEKGTGLGLIICKEFIEKMNGQIRVISKISVGSRFIVSLPVA